MSHMVEPDGECVDMNGVNFTYPFLRGIDPARPPASLVIPEKDLCAMGNMERQYWEIKSRLYNVILFFKKGKFYELYDYDAVIAHREFGLKMVVDTSNRGKMRLAGVPEQSYKEWARLFVFRGYKVGRVEQIREGGGGDEEGNGGAILSAPLPKAKVVPRELVEVLTPGTLKDPAMLSDHNEVFILALAPCQCASLGTGGTATVIVDAVAVDLSRHVAYWCPCVDAVVAGRLREAARDVSSDGCVPPSMMSALLGGDADMDESFVCEPALQSLSALLQQLQPREIVIAAQGDTEEKGADRSCRQLARWVEAEGYQAEMLSLSMTDIVGTHAQATPAHKALQHYFTKLRLTADLPLLTEATLYMAHLPTSTATVAQTVCDAAAAAATKMAATGSLLAWERRLDRGLVLDAATVSNLEIVATLQGGAEHLTLNAQLNRCITNGGKRLFRSWLLRPSAEPKVIAARQAVVRFVLDDRHQALLGGAVMAKSSQTSNDMAHNRVLLTSTQSSNERLGCCGSGGCESDNGEDVTMSRKRPRGVVEDGACLCLASCDFATVDLERNLSRLAELKTATQAQYIAYMDPLVEYKRNLQLILHTLQCFSDLIEWAHALRCYLQHHHQQYDGASQDLSCSLPPLLHELLAQIESASASMAAIDRLFDRNVARAQELLLPAPGACPEYDSAVDALATVTRQLEAERARAQATAFAGAVVNFADVGKDTFLLEVAAAAAPRMTPAGMVERARSARSVKYAVKSLEGLAEAHKAATAAKTAALLNVLSSIAVRVGEHFASLYNALAALSYLDCLFSLARIACPASPLARYCCMPVLAAAADSQRELNRLAGQDGAEEDSAFLHATNLVHPLLATGARTVAVVPNDIVLDDQQGRILLLTGPNMAGKSTLMRTVAVNAMLAQLGGPVLARNMLFRPLDRIFTRIGARDASHKGQSTLYVELSETAEIVRAATSRSLCLIDELGRGTSTHDGLAIAHATLQVLKAHRPRPPLTIFSTHYHALAFEQTRSAAEGSERQTSLVQLGYMDFVLDQGARASHDPLINSQHTEAVMDGLPSITFLYRLVRGVCARSYGVEVALMAGLPEALIRLAKAKSDELARWSALHEDAQLLRRFCHVA